MNQKQNKSTTEFMLEAAYKAWCYHNMFKGIAKEFVSSDMGQQLLARAIHILQQIDSGTIMAQIHACVAYFF